MAHKNTTVLITGATSGIGRVTALTLAAQGYRVLASGRTQADLDALTSETGLTTLVLDVTSADSIAEAVRRVDVLTNCEGVDVLINNAGFAVGGPAEMVSDADLRAQFDVNVFGVMAVTKAFVPGMRRRGSGRIITISSLASHFTFPLLGTYSATKFAVRSLTDALRLELRPFNIQVVTVEPGVVRTPFITRTMNEAAKYQQLDSPYAAAVARSDQLRANSERTAVEPEVIARLIARAVSARHPKARYAGPWFARLGVALLTALPTPLHDWLLTRLSGLTALYERQRSLALRANEVTHG